ncbi:group II intron maturase-specific domain-containing protein, partial [Bacillus sp. OTU2372]|uniref:group II intron maturase-specific domain-containing protein n=1 Tax=Bacillus sp. OTU2372 TaxID=3043858 RepID=UPI00313C1A7D
PWKRKFLGFSFTSNLKPKVRISPQSIKRFKDKIRKLTGRRRSIAMEDRIYDLNEYLVGWVNYYHLADTRSVIAKLEG